MTLLRLRASYWGKAPPLAMAAVVETRQVWAKRGGMKGKSWQLDSQAYHESLAATGKHERRHATRRRRCAVASAGSRGGGVIPGLRRGEKRPNRDLERAIDTEPRTKDELKETSPTRKNDGEVDGG